MGYYFYKVASVDYKWVLLTDEQRKIKYYGDEYIFFQHVKKIPVDSFFIVSDNGNKAYFLGRYFLYPKKIYTLKNQQQLLRGNYLLIFGERKGYNFLNHDYRLVETIKNKANIIGYVVIKK